MRILLVEDHDLLSENLKLGLGRFDEVEEIHVLKDLYMLNDTFFIDRFDIVLMDINLSKILKNKDGLSLAKDIKISNPDVKVVILTGYERLGYEYIAMKDGLDGFISKDITNSELMEKIHDIVNKGSKAFDPGIKKKISLSDIEIDIVESYCSGMSRKEVAKKCNLSVSALSVYLNRIYQKLDVKNYQEMMSEAIRLGFCRMKF